MTALKKILVIGAGIALGGLALFVARMVFLSVALKAANEVITESVQEMQTKNLEQTQKRIEQTSQTAEFVRKERALAELLQDQERRLLSNECQFWMQQHELNPTERTTEKKRSYCGQ